MAKRTPAKSKKKSSVVKPSEPLAHRLDALLHTMRCIAQHEDRLCTLLHDAQQSPRLRASLLKELRTVLEDLPAEEYTFDLQALATEVAEAEAA
jgi:hypothetical protein